MSIQDRTNELLRAAGSYVTLRSLLNQGFLKFLANDQATDNFLEFVYADQLADHLADCCRCDLTDWGFGYCYVAEWYEGCRPAWEFVVDMGENDFKEHCEQYLKTA